MRVDVTRSAPKIELVQLTLTQIEASRLRALCGSISGGANGLAISYLRDPLSVRQELTDKLYTILSNAGL